MGAKKLVEICEGKLKVGRNGEFFRLARYSFIGEFGAIREGIQEDSTFDDPDEIERFIKVCDNRINRARILLNEIAMVLGFDLAALSIVAVILSGRIGKEDNLIRAILHGDPSITFLVIFLLASSIFLLILLVHYRTHVHAWTAFKEGAILSEKYTPQSPTQTK
ncbi:MAG: hypothetical protein U9N41_03850 [Euryarchaeota archaeon]|nr:hypothetical protein [Euryarchaeota archaeon]